LPLPASSSATLTTMVVARQSGSTPQLLLARPVLISVAQCFACFAILPQLGEAER
jgi:hypothetical protein